MEHSLSKYHGLRHQRIVFTLGRGEFFIHRNTVSQISPGLISRNLHCDRQFVVIIIRMINKRKNS